MKIRESRRDDFQALAELQNTIYPDRPAVAEDYVEHYDNIAKVPDVAFSQWIAEIDRQIIGAGWHHRETWNPHPHKFVLVFRVHPDCQGQGIGTALYTTAVESLAQYDPMIIWSNSREDTPRGMRFLEDRGFKEISRDSESWLTLSDFDAKPFKDVPDQMETHGIVIKSYSELCATVPDFDQKLYELEMELIPDIPSDEPFERVTFEKWYEDTLEQEMVLRDAFMVAMSGDEPVGMSNIWGDRASDMLYTGLTGVKRSHRRKGIATALKLEVIKYALEKGHPIIKTDNDQTNTGMLSINYRLGFKKRPAWVRYKKILREA